MATLRIHFSVLLMLFTAIVNAQQINLKNEYLYAMVVLGGNSSVVGTLDLIETISSTDKSNVKITGQLTGLTPSAEHGFHIHELGVVNKLDCNSAGAHFNPDQVKNYFYNSTIDYI